MAARDWDPDENGPVPPESVVVAGNGAGFSGFSGHSGYSGYYGQASSLTMGGDTVTLDATTLNLNATHTSINPSSNWVRSSPGYTTPIEYTFQTSSWRYTFCYILNIFFSPWLILWSKITGRTTGFRVKNPDWDR